MTVVTLGTWESALEDALSEVSRRWPWMTVSVDGLGAAARLVVKTLRTSGMVGLVRVGDDWRPMPGIVDRRVPDRDPPSARSQARDMIAVCDALDLAMSMLGDLAVQW